MNKIKWQNNEQSFLVIITIMSIISILYLFSPFITPIIFASIIGISTYPIFSYINEKTKLKKTSSILTTLLVTALFFMPLIYLITYLGVESSKIYANYESAISGFNYNEIGDEIQKFVYEKELISEKTFLYIEDKMISNFETIKKYIQNGFMGISKTIINSSMGFISFFAITLFTLYFVYCDGKSFVDFIKKLTPLHDDYDDLIIKEISRSSFILTASVLFVAVLQGLSFGLLAFYLNYDVLFLVTAIIMTSFVPVFGSAIVWLPISLYLGLTGNKVDAFIVFIYGSFINGFVIDNLLRPIVVERLNKLLYKDKLDVNSKEYSVLDHPYVIIMSTIGGIMIFGVIGLFFGPLIAVTSVAILNLYKIRSDNSC